MNPYGAVAPGELEQLVAWDKAHVWHPFTAQADWAASSPLVIERGEGVYLYDAEGNRFLDGVASLWCNVHGHRHPTIDAAIREQLDNIAHCTLLGVTHPTAIRLARRLVEIAPPGLTRVFFSDDGATAVEVALKAAFQYWRQKPNPEPGRKRFVSLGGAYHGDTLGDVSVGGVDRFHTLFEPLLFDPLRAPSPYCYRCPLQLSRPECGIACLGEVEKILAAHPGEIAALVLEPIAQGAAGMIVQPEGYLKGVRELTRKHDVLLIADEVAVGFGRTGRMFACEHEDVAPDLLCLAKGLTGGYMPVAATLTTEEVYSAFYGTATEGKTFYHGHTYGGNPIGAAAALATLRIFEDDSTLANLAPKMRVFAERADRLAGLRHVGDVRRKGMLAGVELVADKAERRPYDANSLIGAKVCRKARERGLLIRPLGDVVVAMPPLAINEDEIHFLFDVIAWAVESITETPS